MSEKPTLQIETNQSGIDSLSTLTSAPVTTNSADAERRLLVLRKIAAPLMGVISASASGESGRATPSESAAQFAELIDTTIVLNQQISQMLGLDKADSTARWQAAGAASEIVAAHYRATNQTLTAEEGVAIVTALRKATLQSLNAPDADLVEEESILGRSLKALAPVASAIARFSFGRDPMELLEEVTRHLTKTATDIAAKLGGASETIGSPLYFAVLEVAGEFYMESHFFEKDRLLEMAPEERKEYVQAHGRKIPMEPVWERLDLKMNMLEALTAYLPGAQ